MTNTASRMSWQNLWEGSVRFTHRQALDPSDSVLISCYFLQGPMAYVREYPKKIRPEKWYSTSILGSWRSPIDSWIHGGCQDLTEVVLRAGLLPVVFVPSWFLDPAAGAPKIDAIWRPIWLMLLEKIWENQMLPVVNVKYMIGGFWLWLHHLTSRIYDYTLSIYILHVHHPHIYICMYIPKPIITVIICMFCLIMIWETTYNERSQVNGLHLVI